MFAAILSILLGIPCIFALFFVDKARRDIAIGAFDSPSFRDSEERRKRYNEVVERNTKHLLIAEIILWILAVYLWASFLISMGGDGPTFVPQWIPTPVPVNNPQPITVSQTPVILPTLVPRLTATLTDKICRINAQVMNGNTVYYAVLENDPHEYVIVAGLNDQTPLLRAGDTIAITFYSTPAFERYVSAVVDQSTVHP